MRELTDPKLYQALEYARDLDGAATGEIIERFHLDQTTLAQTLFEVFPIVIAEQDQDMAQLFMSLCFDVICVFQKAFGFLPPQNEMGFDWLEKQAVLDEKIRYKLQNRFLQRSIEDNP